ncbi:Cytochrome b5, partial [Bienertia sinuspersici]
LTILNEQHNIPSNVQVRITPRQRPFLNPGGTREWLPCSSNELKPCLAYARATGFNMHKATSTKNRQGAVSFKYYLCNKAGFKAKKKPIKDVLCKKKEPKQAL